jgi:hypothetical protein
VIALGFEPYEIQVNLARDSDFTATIRAASDPWPPGTSIELRFTVSESSPPIVWEATIDGQDATWNVPAATVATVVNARARHARLLYGTDNGDTWLWGRGRVHAD